MNTNIMKIWIYGEKNTVFWDIIPCGPLKFNRCFKETYHLHLQSQRISQARNQSEAGDNLCSAACFQFGFFPSLFFDSEDESEMFL
jgi:hypothetical protein